MTTSLSLSSRRAGSSPLGAASDALPTLDVGPVDTKRGWIATAVVALLALASRFWLLTSATDKGTPIFDEKHYAPQAFNVSQLGIEENPAYGLVVHPPVAKQIEAIGGLLFGYTPMGWRFTAAICGVLVIVLVMRMVRRLTRSTFVGVLAAILLMCDGVTFVTSRVGMLDIYQVLFVTAAAACLLVDRDQMNERMHRAAERGTAWRSAYGPRLGFRWWRFAAGIMLGLATGVKWSGLYYIAFFGVMVVCFDIARRRRYGVDKPIVGTLRRDAVPAFASLVVLALGTYLFTWLPWFADENSVYRHVKADQIPDGPAKTLSAIMPSSMDSWLYYQDRVLTFHSGLTNSAGNRHPWESKPWTWPMSLRPMLYYIEQGQDVTGCDQPGSCVRAIMLLGTPAMWWLAIPVVAWAFWRAVICRNGAYAFALTGYAAGYVPWFFQFDRQMYFFYATVMVPFFVMMIALILAELLGRRGDSERRRKIGLAIVAAYVALVVANFVYMFPIVAGTPITTTEWNNQLWLPSWR